jgi:hypothetical protein
MAASLPLDARFAENILQVEAYRFTADALFIGKQLHLGVFQVMGSAWILQHGVAEYVDDRKQALVVHHPGYGL